MAVTHGSSIAGPMQRTVACAVAMLACVPAAPAPEATASCSNLASLAWLLGTWHAESRDALIAETWVAASESTYEGRGVTRSGADGSVRDSEDLRLVAMGDGVFYVAKVAHNERPVAFQLTSCSGGRFVFENPAHDFPRRIEYHRVDDVRFEVHVSDGGSRGFRLVFSRPPTG